MGILWLVALIQTTLRWHLNVNFFTPYPSKINVFKVADCSLWVSDWALGKALLEGYCSLQHSNMLHRPVSLHPWKPSRHCEEQLPCYPAQRRALRVFWKELTEDTFWRKLVITLVHLVFQQNILFSLRTRKYQPTTQLTWHRSNKPC